jgi:hypothetical protein
MTDIVAAIRRPFDDLQKLALGTACYLVPVLNVITGLFATGYAFRCARDPTGAMPDWDDLGELFKQGLIAFIISVIYAVPFVIIIGVLFIVFGGVAGFADIGPNVPARLLAATLPVLLIGGIISILYSYLYPAIIIRYAKTYTFEEAFNFTAIAGMAFTASYLKTWFLVVLVAIAGSTALAILSFLTSFTVVVPWLLSAAYSFAILVIAMTVFGELYDELTV